MHFHLHADGSESRGEMRRNAYVADDIDAERLKGLTDAFLNGLCLCLIGCEDALARHPFMCWFVLVIDRGKVLSSS